MKQKHRDIAKDGSGSITLLPEEPEDMWHAYNLISKGDHVRASSVRRVQSETATGSASSERVRVTLTIQVENIVFDSQTGTLSVNGKNVSENKFVKMGAYHTLDLELNREFTIIKAEWDSVALSIVQSATDPTQYADAAAVVMMEGLAHVCLITSTMTIVRQKIDVSVPKKRKGSVQGHEKGLQRFFDLIIQAIQRHINFQVVKCVILASPGFVKDQFYEYMMQEAQRQDMKILLESKQKFLLIHSSSGHKHALKEVLSDPQVTAKLAETKASGEVKALNDFYDMMKAEPDRAFYGLKHVEMAAERLAVQTLMITDELFRSADVKTRKRYVKLVELVKEGGGEVHIFSSAHISGERMVDTDSKSNSLELAQISGVAATLRFPLPELDEVEEDEPTQENNNNAKAVNNNNASEE